jgi:hypothetical protein
MKKFVPIAFAAGWLVFGDWIAGLSFAVLALAWLALPAEEGAPVLALAATMQWVSVTIGYFYHAVTGRDMEATVRADYRSMVLLGLGCVFAMIVGLWCGRKLIQRLPPKPGLRPSHALTFKTLVLVYVVFTAVLGSIALAAYDFGGLAMAILALSYLRLGLLYLLFRRFVARNQWYLVGLVLFVEIVMGITGFYAGFREPLIMAALAFLEVFDKRNVRHWASIGVLGTAMATLGIVWIGVRVPYRQRYAEDLKFQNDRSARIDALQAAVNQWMNQPREGLLEDVDMFIERMWTIYYPALTLERVPLVLPHTGGELMMNTLKYTFEPRLLFPDKPSIQSDSEMVRKYAGVMVAGAEQDTDIAFGYAAESYVDFGVPGMFLPSFVWALFIGVACQLVFREYHHRDMAVSVVTVIGWFSLYLFERSWTKTIGFGGTLLIYAGGLCYILDRLWYEKFKNFYAGGGVHDGDAVETMEPSPRLHLHPQPHSK